MFTTYGSMANLGAVRANCIHSHYSKFSGGKNARAPHLSSHTRIEQISRLLIQNSDRNSFCQSIELPCLIGRTSRRTNLPTKDFQCTPLTSVRSGVGPSRAQREDFVLERDNLLLEDSITNGDITRQGLFPERVEGEELNVVRIQEVGKYCLKVPAFCLASALLALGLCLSFCKPAFAKTAERSSTVTATMNEKGEVEVQDRELDTGEKETGKDSLGKSEENDFGEGSDFSNDPTEVLLRSYLERHPTDLKALQALLYLRLKKGEVNAAMSVVDKLIELEPSQLEWKYIKAQAFEFVGDLEQARQAFQAILELKPLSARALQGLAVVMQKNGEDEQALELLAEAVKKAVDSGQAKETSNLRMLLGQMHTIQGNLDEAMEQYRTVVEEDPQDYRPYLCQGLVYSIIGEEAEAEKNFKRYRKLCPKDFPHRGFLDELMLRAKTESRKLNERLKKEEEYKAKGKKMPKPMRQPLATGSTKKEESSEN